MLWLALFAIVAIVVTARRRRQEWLETDEGLAFIYRVKLEHREEFYAWLHGFIERCSTHRDDEECRRGAEQLVRGQLRYGFGSPRSRELLAKKLYWHYYVYDELRKGRGTGIPAIQKQQLAFITSTISTWAQAPTFLSIGSLNISHYLAKEVIKMLLGHGRKHSVREKS